MNWLGFRCAREPVDKGQTGESAPAGLQAQ
jgi:hypothetical protein